jgi:hypothetical protein
MFDIDEFTAKLRDLAKDAAEYSATYRSAAYGNDSSLVAILKTPHWGQNHCAEPLWIGVENKNISNHAAVSQESTKAALINRIADLTQDLRRLPIFDHDNAFIEVGVFRSKNDVPRLKLILDGHAFSDKPLEFSSMEKRLRSAIEMLSATPIDQPLQNYIVNKHAVFAPDAGTAVLKIAIITNPKILQDIDHLPLVRSVKLYVQKEDIVASVKAAMTRQAT